MNEAHYALGELDRRAGNVFRWGTVASVDPATATATVDMGDLVTDSLPWLTPRAGADRAWSTPDVGEQVLVVSNGDPSQGAIIGSAFSDAHPANGSDGDTRRMTFSDGTVIEFNRATSAMNVTVAAAGQITLTIGGTQLLLKDGQATLTAAAIKLDGPVTCTQTLTVQGLLTYLAGLAGSGGAGGASASITGNVHVTSGEVTVDGIGVKAHHHIEHDGPSTGAAQV